MISPILQDFFCFYYTLNLELCNGKYLTSFRECGIIQLINTHCFTQVYTEQDYRMFCPLLTTLTSQYRESVRYNTLSQESISAVTGLRAIFIIIIAIRRAVVG